MAWAYINLTSSKPFEMDNPPPDGEPGPSDVPRQLSAAAGTVPPRRDSVGLGTRCKWKRARARPRWADSESGGCPARASPAASQPAGHHMRPSRAPAGAGDSDRGLGPQAAALTAAASHRR